MPIPPRDLFDRMDGGLATRDLPQDLALHASPDLLNVEFRGRRIGKAKGFTELGTDSDAGSPGWSLFNHRILSNEEVLVKTIATKLKFYDEVTGIHHLLTDATFTANTRWWFDSFNGYLFGGNGVENFMRWRGSSWGALDGAVLAAATTIQLEAGQGARFATTGDGMIEGDTFSWTGKSTDQLTGVSGLGSNHADGSRVIAKADTTTYSTNPKGSVGAIFRNRLYVRDDANPNLLYFSKVADATTPHDDLANFAISGGVGDAGFFVMSAAILGVRKFIAGDNTPIFVVATADGQLHSVSVADSGSTTVGTDTPLKDLGIDIAAVGCLWSTENDLVAIDKVGTLRTAGYGEQSTTLRTERLSDGIKPTTDAYDFSSGAVRYADRKICMLGASVAAGANDTIIVKDTNPSGFLLWNHLALNDIVEWKNDFYGISSISGRTLKLFDGRTANGLSIASRYSTARTDSGFDLIEKELRKMRIRGAMSSACQMRVKVFYDHIGTPDHVFLLTGGNASVIDEISGAVAAGAIVFGSATNAYSLGLGSGLIPFSATLNINAPKRYTYVRIVIEEVGVDTDWELHRIRLYPIVKDANAEIASKQVAST